MPYLPMVLSQRSILQVSAACLSLLTRSSTLPDSRQLRPDIALTEPGLLNNFIVGFETEPWTHGTTPMQERAIDLLLLSLGLYI